MLESAESQSIELLSISQPTPGNQPVFIYLPIT